MYIMTIGIDLGTTNSLISYWDGERAHVIPNALDEPLTPSVVSVDEDRQILVGRAAKERLITHPAKTAASFKRFMGTQKTYELDPFRFTPIDLSHFIIKSLKRDAEAFLDKPITEAVISVPAYFHDSQRQATKQAAQLAGLRVERLVTEPTAAALAYRLHEGKGAATFLVLDLGGGTYDVSVLEWFEGVMEVRAVAGDNYLGGDDFDAALASILCKRFELNPENTSQRMLGVLRQQAERAKITTSDCDTADVAFRFDGVLYRQSLTQRDIAECYEPLYQRLRGPIERVMRDLRLKPERLDAVVLVGGATRMPAIRDMAARLFHQFPYCNLDPDKTVALGAAIQAALAAQDESLSEIVMTDVSPFTLGVDVSRTDDYGNIIESGIFSPIIERNSTVPVSRIQRYFPLTPKQAFQHFNIFQGEHRKVENNVKIGEIKVPIKAGEKDKPGVDVRFTYDVNGLLEVDVLVLSTGLTKNLVIEQSPGAMTPDEIKRRLAELSKIKIHPRDKAENRLLLARGERLYEESIGERRMRIEEVLARLNVALESQDDRIIRKTVVDIKELFDMFDREGF